MRRQKQIPDYEIREFISTIHNPEIPIIETARTDIVEVVKDKLSESDLQKIKERGLL